MEYDKLRKVARISGQGGAFVGDTDNPAFIYLGNAGTAMRPLTAVLSASHGQFLLDGTARMRERPIADLVDGLQQVRSNMQQ